MLFAVLISVGLIVFFFYILTQKFNVVAFLTLDSQTFFDVAVNGYAPSTRQAHSSCSVFNRFLVIFGGEDDENWELDDLWLLDYGQ